MGTNDKERGEPASFDRRTGAVHGSGSGAGGHGNPDEDYDSDPMGGGGAEPVGAPKAAGSGHPLPASDEARHNEIPEHAERDKGRGDDSSAAIQPAEAPVTPEGEAYRYGDLGRGPGSDETDELKRDQAEHQDRGQSIAAAETDRD
jgi:hypothetical protein